MRLKRHLIFAYIKKLITWIFLTYSLQAAAGNVLADSDMNTKSGANRTDDKGVEAKYTNHSIDEVASMVHATVSAFDTKVQFFAAYLATFTVSHGTLHIMSDCIFNSH
jgi:hypothetical protein